MSDAKNPENNSVGQRLPVSLDTMIRDAVKDVLNTAQQKQVIERLKPKFEMMAVSVERHHSGPLPSVGTAQGYESIEKGSFARIIAMAERDQSAVIDSDTFKAKSDSNFRLQALWLGFCALLVIIGTVIYLAINNHEWPATAVAGIGIAGIVGTFVNARTPIRTPNGNG